MSSEAAKQATMLLKEIELLLLKYPLAQMTPRFTLRGTQMQAEIIVEPKPQPQKKVILQTPPAIPEITPLGDRPMPTVEPEPAKPEEGAKEEGVKSDIGPEAMP